MGDSELFLVRQKDLTVPHFPISLDELKSILIRFPSTLPLNNLAASSGNRARGQMTILKKTILLFFLVGPAVVLRSQIVTPQSKVAATASMAGTASQRELLDKYCVTCHNEQLRTGGMSLERIDVQNIAGNA